MRQFQTPKSPKNCENISSNWSNFIQKENKQKKYVLSKQKLDSIPDI